MDEKPTQEEAIEWLYEIVKALELTLGMLLPRLFVK